MKTISIVINARVESSRVDRKMIRPFGGSTLLDVALSKLSKIEDINVYLAAAEDEIFSIHKKYNNINLLKRSLESVSKGWKPHCVTFAHYNNIKTTHIFI